MEEMDTQSLVFAGLPKYHSPQTVVDFLQKLLRSEDMAIIRQAKA